MSENSWVLKGVDPSIRESAAAKAARLGVSLSDYLTDVVLRSALVDQLNAQTEAEPTSDVIDDVANFASPSDGPETYAVRHRLRGLERRLNSAVGSLDDALFDLTGRVGDVEGLAADTTTALAHTQQETSAAVAGLQLDLVVVEENLAALAAAQAERCAAIDAHLAHVEITARGAERSAAILADAHETLKHAVAGDFAEFAHDLGNRLQASLADVRLAANDAAEQADAAVAHLITELRHVRDVFDERLEVSAADTRANMHAAFADAAERLGALAERVVDNERYTNRVTDALRAQLADVEDGAQTALEETAETLRLADTRLANDLARISDEQDAALESTRAQLSAEIVAVREDQFSHLARLKLVDLAVGNTINELADTREALTQRVNEGENQVRALLARAEADWNARHNGATARLDAAAQDSAHIRQTLAVEIERVEACTQAALQKLAADINQGDTALEQRIELAAQSFAASLAQVRGQTQAEQALVREEHAGALARLTLLDGALARLESAATPVDARLTRLESALAAIDPTLPSRIAEIEAASEDTQALSSRLDAQRALINDTSEQLQDVARMLTRVAAQNSEVAAKSEARVHQVEMAMADLRLEHLATTEKASPSDLVEMLESRLAADNNAAAGAIQALQGRINAIESAQSSAIQALTADIARFIDENDRRLAALDGPSAADRDLAAAFDALRKRVEDRIIGVEQRSVRMLEQVADTVAMIEQRFVASQRDEDLARSA